MTDQSDLHAELTELLTLDDDIHPAWDEPIVCRVEVDLSGWLAQLAGGSDWEVTGEDEDETCISFALREKSAKPTKKSAPKTALKMAEVTLYHNGYAVVDVEGKSLFEGALTSGTSDCAHLSYYHADSGEPVTLN